ncbi:cupin domain-containing protein [Phenylobacterium sp.]|uniref:cupin domain-containing protein n=1 Tax=Phenylobacterium sp. TaxID=1871053 RepID=UPI002FC71297
MTRHWPLPLFAATVLGAAPAQVGAQDLRLTPAEIAAAAKGGAGAGTSGVAGIQTTTLYGDPTKPGLYVIEIRVPANTRIAAHRHRDDRTAVVISGTWWFGYGSSADEDVVKALPPGSFYTEPANRPHFALTRAEPVVAFITGVGPTDTQFTDPARTPNP